MLQKKKKSGEVVSRSLKFSIGVNLIYFEITTFECSQRDINKKKSHKHLLPLCCVTLQTDISHCYQAVCLSIMFFLGCYYIFFLNKPLFFSMVMTGLQLLTNNTEDYAKACNSKVVEQKTSQIWRNTHPSHITRTHKAMKSNAWQQHKPHLVSLSDTSVYMCTHPCKHTHTYNVHYCQVKSLHLILNP